MNATTPNGLVHETGHYNFLLMSKGKAIFLLACLLMISSPSSLLMTASAEYFDFIKPGTATFFYECIFM